MTETIKTDTPTNWGRWGAEDQLGTLNLIDAAATARAAAEVREGRHVSLARPVTPVPLTTGAGPLGSPATMPAGVMQAVNFNGFEPLAVTDTLVVNTHNATLTHLDAFVHIPVGGEVYPGVPVKDAMTTTGAVHGSADVYGAGIVTRAVLLDLAPGGGSLPAETSVGESELDAALERAGAELHPGDAVAVRAGWDPNQPIGHPVPGLDLSAARWMHRHGVSVYLGDVGDQRPPRFPMAVHQVVMARLGLPLVDAAVLDDLAEVCASLDRWSFMLVLAPPRITRTTGLLVNPLAIF